MKIVSILVILAVFYKHSEGLTCKTTADWTGTITLTDKTDCSGTTCARPKREAASYVSAADGIVWGCGEECTDPDSCLTCTEENCNVEPIECRTDAGDVNAKSLCPDKTDPLAGETECKRTLYDGTNFGTDGTWGCGGCAEGAEDCVACPGNLCNNVNEGETHKCHEYRKNSESQLYEKAGTTKDCHETTPGCKMPAAEYDDSQTGEFEECGKVCPADTADTCRGCDDAECNDVDSPTVFMCKKGPGNTASDGVNALNSIFCDGTCTRPTVAYGKAVANPAAYGCGDCSGVDNCVSCTTKNCNIFPDDGPSHKCFRWTWDPTNKWTVGAKEDCQAGVGEHECNMPIKATADQLQEDIDEGLGGCGPCGADKSATCKTTAPEQNKEGTHKCHTWEWKSAESKWTFSEGTINCYTGISDDLKKCSLPKDRSKEAGFVAADACSKCGSDETANANCMTSEPGENSGRRMLFSLLALALPIFYALL